MPSHSRYNNDDELLSRERHIIKMFVADMLRNYKRGKTDCEILIIDFLIFHSVFYRVRKAQPVSQDLKV